jgi:hypothetical protein
MMELLSQMFTEGYGCQANADEVRLHVRPAETVLHDGGALMCSA